MTTQLPSRDRSDTDTDRAREFPDVLFEEARRRRRRRWMSGGALIAAAIIAAGWALGFTGGGGDRSGGTTHGQPSGSGSGASSGHVSASRLFPDAPVTGRYYTGPGASCLLAPHNRYLPPWSGCVSTLIADVSGNGPDLILTYSRLSHESLSGLPPRNRESEGASRLYPAKQAMLSIVSRAGNITTAPISYMTAAVNKTPARLERAEAAALISVAHVSNEPGKQIFVQIGQISSGSNAVAYSVHDGRLVSTGVTLGYGGDSATQATFQCVGGNPPTLVQRSFELIRGIKLIRGRIYGRWQETTLTYAWRGSRLMKIAQSTSTGRELPNDRVGAGCIEGIG